MNPAEVLEVLERHGALMRGHFALSSGKHSDVFVQKFRVFERPRLTQSLGDALAQRFARDFELVASPAVGAIALGFAVALAADKRVIFSERVDDRMVFRRGFEVGTNERTLVVEDVVTTGGSAREVVDLVRAAGGSVMGVGCLLDRTPGPVDLGAPLRALARLEAPAWDERECPLCEQNHPLADPGSRRLQASAPRSKNAP